MCEKAPNSGADLVFLDLEDACAPVVKESARAIAVNALVQSDWAGSSGVSGQWFSTLLGAMATWWRSHRCSRGLDVIIIPKARTARDVWWFDVLLTQLEAKLGLTKRIALEVLIEEQRDFRTLLRSPVQAPAGGDHFGAGDLSASLHSRVDGNFDPVSDYPAISGISPESRSCRPLGERVSMPSTLRIRPIKTPPATAGQPGTPAFLGTTASGLSIPVKSHCQHRVRPHPEEVADAEQSIEIYRSPRPAVSVPLVVTANSSTRRTCDSRATCSTRRALSRPSVPERIATRWTEEKPHERSDCAQADLPGGAVGHRQHRGGALRAVIEHPQLTLVGVHVNSADKAGLDAGELCGSVQPASWPRGYGRHPHG